MWKYVKICKKMSKSPNTMYRLKTKKLQLNLRNLAVWNLRQLRRRQKHWAEVARKRSYDNAKEQPTSTEAKKPKAAGSPTKIKISTSGTLVEEPDAIVETKKKQGRPLKKNTKASKQQKKLEAMAKKNAALRAANPSYKSYKCDLYRPPEKQRIYKVKGALLEHMLSIHLKQIMCDYYYKTFCKRCTLTLHMKHCFAATGFLFDSHKPTINGLRGYARI